MPIEEADDNEGTAMTDTELWRLPSVLPAEAPAILIVDDEPMLLETLTQQVGSGFRVVTASDAVRALAALEHQGPFAMVISDLLMPGIDGIELLGQVRHRYPEITRILLTSRGDMTSAISAINDGNVFRFLVKPMRTAELRRVVREAMDKYKATCIERDVLDRTLRASLQAIFGCLQLASPQAFARAGRIRNLVGAVCTELGLGNVWEIEVAAMASQLGCVTLPPTVLRKLDHGQPLNDDDQVMVDALPAIAAQLLGAVPMLDDVLAIVRGIDPVPRHQRVGATAHSRNVSLGISVLRSAIDLESFESRGLGTPGAIAMLERDSNVNTDVLAALRKVRQLAADVETIRAYPLAELLVGMRIMEDVKSVNGPTLVGRGMVVTEVLLDRLSNFHRMGQLIEPVLATSIS